MKHVAGDLDVSHIDQPFARVIRKALAKEPDDRYQSAQAMVDDLMGHSDLQQSVASLGPETLTVIAEKAMRESPKPAPAPAGTQSRATDAYFAKPADKKPGAKVWNARPGPKVERDPYRYNLDMRPRHLRAGNQNPKRPGLGFGGVMLKIIAPIILGFMTLGMFAALGDGASGGIVVPMVVLWTVYGFARTAYSRRKRAQLARWRLNNTDRLAKANCRLGAAVSTRQPEASPCMWPMRRPRNRHLQRRSSRIPSHRLLRPWPRT